MSAELDLSTLDARARGLRTHLFRRAEIEQLAALDLRSLASALSRSGKLSDPIAEPITPAAIEAALRKTASHHLSVLSTWARTGSSPALDVFYAEQDRRILRAMLRGAIQGAPTELRAAGLLPTPRLPERALAVLSHQPTAAGVAMHLVALRHPDADRLLALAARTQPVLFDLDLALLRGFAERSVASARAGDRNLRDVVAWRVDAANVETALAIAESPRDVAAQECFVEGGASVSRAAFAQACGTSTRVAAAESLGRSLAGRALGAVVRATGGDPRRFERASLAGLIAEQTKRSRTDPLSSAPLVSFLLRLEAQSVDLRRVAGGASLGAPASNLRLELVTP